VSAIAKSALRTIILELARRKGLRSIQIGVAFDLDSGCFSAVKFKIDPKAKLDPDDFDLAVSDLTRDVEWQRDWKDVEDEFNRNPKRSCKILKSRYPTYRSIPDSILKELFRILRHRNKSAVYEIPPPDLAPTKTRASIPGRSIPEKVREDAIDAAAIKDYFEKNEEQSMRKLSKDSSLKARKALALEITRYVLDSNAGKPDNRIMRNLRKLKNRRVRKLRKDRITSQKASHNKTNSRTKNDRGHKNRIA